MDRKYAFSMDRKCAIDSINENVLLLSLAQAINTASSYNLNIQSLTKRIF